MGQFGDHTNIGFPPPLAVGYHIQPGRLLKCHGRTNRSSHQAAGFIGGPYPVGVSVLGRLWAHARMLSPAYAYEQATPHRRPPPFLK